MRDTGFVVPRDEARSARGSVRLRCRGPFDRAYSCAWRSCARRTAGRHDIRVRRAGPLVNARRLSCIRPHADRRRDDRRDHSCVPETLAMMTSNQLTPDQRATARMFGRPIFAAGHGYGMGVAVVWNRRKPIRCVAAAASAHIGWPGAYGGWWQADPNDRLRADLPRAQHAGTGSDGARDWSRRMERDRQLSCARDGVSRLERQTVYVRKYLLKWASVRSHASLAAAASKRGVVSLLKPCCVPG